MTGGSDIVSLAIGLVVFVVFGIPIILWMLTLMATLFALQVGIVVAIGGYIVGIPWAIWRRVVDGEWPDGG